MPICAMVLHQSPVRLWGLSSRQRLERMLRRMGVFRWIEDLDQLASEDSLLILRGDFLFDDRILRGLVNTNGLLLLVCHLNENVAVAAHVSAEKARAARRILLGDVSAEKEAGLRRVFPEDLASAYRRSLRQFDLPYLLPISVEARLELEKRLFSGSYKGVTDLVTKWVWPLPARWATRACVRMGVTPNQVTTLSLLLAVSAGIFFLRGQYGWGLFCAWIMTFLDTVDGKLARVTVSYTSFGDIFDHLIDLVSPPLWYIAWGEGLASFGIWGLSLPQVHALIVGGYVGGRLAELIFKRWMEPSGLFCWRPVDSYFRLITGRRNPNLILFTLGFLAGRPDFALVAVTLWTVASTLFLLGRVGLGWKQSLSDGPLHSWFEQVDPKNPRPTLAEKWFIHHSDRQGRSRV